jgi:alpha-D-ribose 1-methylphosphonate 5-triphosphate synthase subunit PhnL
MLATNREARYLQGSVTSYPILHSDSPCCLVDFSSNRAAVHQLINMSNILGTSIVLVQLTGNFRPILWSCGRGT